MRVGSDSPTIGVVGGGQLGRMLGEAATPLGIEVRVVDPTPDPPAAPVVRETITGGFDDPAAIRDLAESADVVTYEIELADPDLLERVADETGVPVHPAPETLRMTRDKLIEKQRLADNDIPVPGFRGVDDADDLQVAFEAYGRPVMLKARRGGYDGRGNAPVEDVEEARAAFGSLEGLIAEDMVAFDRELSVMGVRGPTSRTTFAVVENIHEEEILRTTIAPGRTDDATRRRARAVARDVLDVLEGRGVFGIELFEIDGEILVNEIAPRPHNSGHYTIEAAVTSQFEQHARAVAGYPLGSTQLRDRAVMANILGDGTNPRAADLACVDAVLETPGAALHWYGKREVRPLRKMGHITLLPEGDASRSELLGTANDLVAGLRFD